MVRVSGYITNASVRANTSYVLYIVVRKLQTFPNYVLLSADCRCYALLRAACAAHPDRRGEALHVHGPRVHVLVGFGDENRPPGIAAAFAAPNRPHPDLRPVVGAPRETQDVAPLHPAKRLRQLTEPAHEKVHGSPKRPVVVPHDNTCAVWVQLYGNGSAAEANDNH